MSSSGGGGRIIMIFVSINIMNIIVQLQYILKNLFICWKSNLCQEISWMPEILMVRGVFVVEKLSLLVRQTDRHKAYPVSVAQ